LIVRRADNGQCQAADQRSLLDNRTPGRLQGGRQLKPIAVQDIQIWTFCASGSDWLAEIPGVLSS
jgi:hypothetical protein